MDTIVAAVNRQLRIKYELKLEDVLTRCARNELQEMIRAAADGASAVSWAAWGTTLERTCELRRIDYFDI